MNRLAILLGCAGLSVASVCGCTDSLANQAKKSPNSIIGKTTDEVGKFDPNAKQEVSDSKVRADDPILYAMQAYGPIMEQISKLDIQHAVDLYQAEHGHYPQDYNEFVWGVLKPNHIRLPLLPAGWSYAYDVQNHKLEVVRPKERPQNANPAGAAANQAAPGG